MPEVLCSIVVPVFNRRNFLHRCVTSLQKLHLSSYEIILVDDGSQNETRVACDQYASDDARIHVIHQENQGVVVARAAGWKASEGKYIAFVDSDDWLDTDSYTGLLQQMEEHASIDIGIPRLILEYEDGSSQDMFSEHEKRVLDPKECAREIFLEQKSFCWEVGKIYRRTILDHWKPDSIAYPREDLDMFWKMLRISRKVQYDGTAIYHYRIHPQNSHTIDILQQDGMRSLLHVWRDIHVDSDIDLKQNVCQRILLATLERIYARYFSGRVDTNMDEVRQEIDLLRHIYHMMPDRTVMERLCRTRIDNPLARKSVRDAIVAHGFLAFWGYGKEGRRWEQVFQSAECSPSLIFDRSAGNADSRIVQPSREAVLSCGQMILITSTRYADAIAEELRGYGLEENKSFIRVERLLDEIGARYYRAAFGLRKDDGRGNRR